jgi:hypothetical protein
MCGNGSIYLVYNYSIPQALFVMTIMLIMATAMLFMFFIILNKLNTILYRNN